ncbi:MAG: hypothetical protein AAB553_07355 [Patescibacteria group bacterium]
MRSFFIVLFAVFLALLSFPHSVLAKIGVGVGTGKIHVDEKLKPGIIYELPPLTVFNTGDVASDYEVNVAYHEKQPELKPDESWFIFSPEKFHLEPGKSQEVTIKLNLPVRTEPGDYFAYLEGHPYATSKDGNTTVGIAAAAKLYFTVVPGSFLEGIYFKVLSFWQVYAPWPQRVLIGLFILASILLLKRFFHIQVNLKKPSDQAKKDG